MLTMAILPLSFSTLPPFSSSSPSAAPSLKSGRCSESRPSPHVHKGSEAKARSILHFQHVCKKGTRRMRCWRDGCRLVFIRPVIEVRIWTAGWSKKSFFRPTRLAFHPSALRIACFSPSYKPLDLRRSSTPLPSPTQSGPTFSSAGSATIEGGSTVHCNTGRTSNPSHRRRAGFDASAALGNCNPCCPISKIALCRRYSVRLGTRDIRVANNPSAPFVVDLVSIGR